MKHSDTKQGFNVTCAASREEHHTPDKARYLAGVLTGESGK
jgi:hypothetical protein